ncbi:MAG: type II secretion system F family protein [Alphaproteobacteria bacterium]|nr:type II secretion system F family protein [Alphaproteobacteria bacterium]MBV8549618.1 type II secretion system F family protein [Alphaproteobacteria bacterium]
MDDAVLMGLAACIVSTCVFLLLFGKNDGDKALERRLTRIKNVTQKTTVVDTAKTEQTWRSVSDSTIPQFDRLIKNILPNPEKIRVRLTRTGKNIKLGEYLLVSLVLLLGTYSLLVYLAAWPKLTAFFVGVVVGIGVPHKVVGMWGTKRAKKFLASFPEAIDTMCRGLRSGLPVVETFKTVASEMPDPVSTEFVQISDAIKLGVSIENAMWQAATRLDVPEFRFLIIAMAIQRETGGNLSATLANLAELLRRRRQLKLKIRALSSEARASAMIIGSLPFIMFTLLMVVNADYMSTLFTDPKGKFMIGFALGMIALGWGVMNKMIAFEV